MTNILILFLLIVFVIAIKSSSLVDIKTAENKGDYQQIYGMESERQIDLSDGNGSYTKDEGYEKYVDQEPRGLSSLSRRNNSSTSTIPALILPIIKNFDISKETIKDLNEIRGQSGLSINKRSLRSLSLRVHRDRSGSFNVSDVGNLRRIAGNLGKVTAGVAGYTAIRAADGLGRVTREVSSSVISDLDDVSGDLMKLSPVALVNFLISQIKLFKDKILYIFDDNEHPCLLKLEIPDLNFLHIIPNLKKDISFALYDKQHGNKDFDILTIDNNITLKNSRFDSKRPTVFITHGFLTSSNGPSVTLIRDAYLNNRDYNVITVNWSPISIGSYTIARILLPRVGRYVGAMINFLYKNGMNPKTTTLIGHSLGAHVMGFAGKIASSKVNHTIGLDPAWPLFVGLPDKYRISKNDAYNVEIIHTNAGLLGIPGPIGHFDFYPNGGLLQNGCICKEYTACSHSRSYKYVAEEIEKEGPGYYAIQCGTYLDFELGLCSYDHYKTIMGALDQVGATKGIYFLDTKASKPFSVG